MTEALLSRWAKALWSLFLPDIQRGLLFYLAVDESVLQKTFPGGEAELAGKGIEDAFHHLCRSQYVIKGRFASLRADALLPQSDGRSLAICLAAQQVVVVARMTEDEHFSRDEYFPRLRECIGLAPINSNPLPFDQFRAIWKTLEQEILSIPGAGPSSITFREVAGRKEKSRALPVSQALLTQYDLSVISGYWDPQRDSMDSASLIRVLDRSRLHLTRRGQRLCVLEGQRGKVIQQVIDFLKRPCAAPQEIAGVEVRGKIPSFVVFIQDLGLEESVALRLIIGKEQVESGRRFSEELEVKLKGRLGIIFEDTGTYFKELTENRLLSPFEPIVFLGRTDMREGILTRLREASVLRTPELMVSDVSKDYQFYYFRDGLGIEVLAKHFDDPNLAQEQCPTVMLTMIGGLVIDGRNNTYLRGRTPVAVKQGDRVLEGAERLLVNGIETSVEQALERFRQVFDYEIFEVSFAGRSLVIRVSSRQSASPVNQSGIGFRAVGPSQFIGTCEDLDSRLIGLTGVAFCDHKSEGTPAGLPAEMLLSFVSVPMQKWVSITNEQLLKIEARLSSSSSPAALKNLAISRLKVTRRVPVTIYSII